MKTKLVIWFIGILLFLAPFICNRWVQSTIPEHSIAGSSLLKDTPVAFQCFCFSLLLWPLGAILTFFTPISFLEED